LISAVLELADGDQKLTDNTRLLILGALESDQALQDALDGTGQSLADAASVGPAAHAPIGAYLKSVRVAGFRGVGTALTVPLYPGPGLTVIAGRNGSGKSSIAEALEMALTGGSYRWSKQSNAVWTANWRNLHGDVPAEIRVELAEEGQGVTTIGVDWSSDAGLTDGTHWVQRPGAKRQPGRETLGWAVPLQLYRPLPSYDEVGGVLEGTPSGLFDKLHSLLGLQPINDGQARLSALLKKLQIPAATAKAALTELNLLLAGSTDPRAAQASALVGKRAPDLAAVEQLATGSAPEVGGTLDTLKVLGRVTWPEQAEVDDAAGELRTAVTDLAAQASSAVDVLASRSRLLSQALELHQSSGDIDCPVCGVGHLDQAWADATREALSTEQAEVAALNAAQARLSSARREARRLTTGLPPLPSIDDAELTTLEPARQYGKAWDDAPAGDLELVDHLLSKFSAVAESMKALQDQARLLVAAREDLWAPLALKLGHWASLVRIAAQTAAEVVEVKSASDWLKASEGDLRNQRLAPLADRAREIWALLRQESNVDLGAIRLEGSSTRRRVELMAEVDGVDTGALGVMSQGELHALALSLFLPRATAPDSPFRFVVLDDPIQAMDPAKVEGFVKVLQELAKERQVIVLSHDDRLPAAVRRAKVKAQILEVTRDNGSVVTIRESLHPSSRYLDDAFALAMDVGVPDDVKDRIVPGLCRLAMESAAFAVYEGKVIAAGGGRQQVESAWDELTTLRQRLAMAIVGDKKAEIKAWLGSGRRSEAFTVCNRGVHAGSIGDHAEEVRAVRTAVKDLRAMA
jgi:ABC-type hemin transport system ATPase subunit